MSPGNGETMSKHVVEGGDVAGLLDRFAQLQHKAGSEREDRFPSSRSRRRDWTAFGYIACWKQTGSRVTWSMLLRSLLHVGAGARRPIRLMVKHWSVHCLRSSAANHAYAQWSKRRAQRTKIGVAFAGLKKAAIVALARKLLIALWKYVTAGVVIEGAVMKSA